MRIFSTRMAIPLLAGIVFGFFISCSSTSSVNKSESGTEELSTRELEKRKNSVEKQISKNPDDAGAYFQKGDLLNRLAHRQDAPADRSRQYVEMRDALSRAGAIYQSQSNQTGEEQVDELLKVSWSYEHNQGVEILQTDSTLGNNDFRKAAAHFNNAIIIIPDSVVSYKMKARAHYRNHQTDEAISTLELAQKHIDPVPTAVMEQLAFLYLEKNLTGKAVDLYEKAESFSDDNLNLLHGLANAYITSKDHDKAVELLETLLENEPENLIYLQSYGNELYNMGIQNYDSLQAVSPYDTLSINRLSARTDTLLDQAEEQYLKALKLNGNSTELKKQIATFYKNYAVHLTRVKSLFPEQEQQNIEQKIKNNLSQAVSYFEELVEASPEQSQYWKHLYQAYSYLGMQQKANEAKAKANL